MCAKSVANQLLVGFNANFEDSGVGATRSDEQKDPHKDKQTWIVSSCSFPSNCGCVYLVKCSEQKPATWLSTHINSMDSSQQFLRLPRCAARMEAKALQPLQQTLQAHVLLQGRWSPGPHQDPNEKQTNKKQTNTATFLGSPQKQQASVVSRKTQYLLPTIPKRHISPQKMTRMGQPPHAPEKKKRPKKKKKTNKRARWDFGAVLLRAAGELAPPELRLHLQAPDPPDLEPNPGVQVPPQPGARRPAPSDQHQTDILKQRGSYNQYIGYKDCHANWVPAFL